MSNKMRLQKFLNLLLLLLEKSENKQREATIKDCFFSEKKLLINLVTKHVKIGNRDK